MSNELVVLVVNDETNLKQEELELIRFLTQEFNQRKTEIKLISVEKFLEIDATKRPLWLEAYPQDTVVTFLPLCRGFELNDGAISHVVDLLQAKPELVDSTAVAVFPSGTQTQLQIQNGLQTYLSMMLGTDETNFVLKNKLAERIAQLDINNYEETLTVLKEILRQLPAKKTLQRMYNEQPIAEVGLVKKAKDQIEDASSFVSRNGFNIAFGLVSAGTLLSIDRNSSLALIYYGLYVLGATTAMGAKKAFPQVSNKVFYLAEKGVNKFANYGDGLSGAAIRTLTKFGLLADKLGNETEKTMQVLRANISSVGDEFQDASQSFMKEISALRISGLDQTQQLVDQITRTLKRGGDITEDNLRLLREGLHQSFQDIRKDVNYRGERLTVLLDQRMQGMENIVDKGVGLVGQAANVAAKKGGDAAQQLATDLGEAAKEGKILNAKGKICSPCTIL